MAPELEELKEGLGEGEQRQARPLSPANKVSQQTVTLRVSRGMAAASLPPSKSPTKPSHMAYRNWTYTGREFWEMWFSLEKLTYYEATARPN